MSFPCVIEHDIYLPSTNFLGQRKDGAHELLRLAKPLVQQRRQTGVYACMHVCMHVCMCVCHQCVGVTSVCVSSVCVCHQCVCVISVWVAGPDDHGAPANESKSGDWVGWSRGVSERSCTLFTHVPFPLVQCMRLTLELASFIFSFEYGINCINNKKNKNKNEN